MTKLFCVASIQLRPIADHDMLTVGRSARNLLRKKIAPEQQGAKKKTLLEAVTFVRHVFNMASLDDCTKSWHCMGVASTKQPLIVKQAPPLLLVHLQAIHKTLENTEDPWEACFCGMVLFCT